MSSSTKPSRVLELGSTVGVGEGLNCWPQVYAAAVEPRKIQPMPIAATAMTTTEMIAVRYFSKKVGWRYVRARSRRPARAPAVEPDRRTADDVDPEAAAGLVLPPVPGPVALAPPPVVAAASDPLPAGR